MKISTRSLYGLRLLYHLAQNYNQGPLQLSEISARERISEKYLSQIVIILRTAGIVTSVRGNQGGYLLAAPPGTVSVLSVVESLEGELLGLPEAENPLTDSAQGAEEVWTCLRKAMRETLSSITLEDVVRSALSRKRILDFSI